MINLRQANVKLRRQTENATIGDGLDTDMSEDIAKEPVEFVVRV